MINLWFEESYWTYRNGIVSGPEKVVRNFIKSLEQEKVPYAINEDKYEYNFLMQYEHQIAYKKHEKLEHDSCFIGPQWVIWNPLSNFLIDNPQYYNKLIVPSEWVRKGLIDKCNIAPDKIASWPVGIEIPNLQKNIEVDCLIYFKRRSEKELSLVKKFLDNKGVSYTIIGYGDYSEGNFFDTLSKVKYCFLLNGTESQGIAVQEIMATNTPLLVWDLKEWLDQGEKWRMPASSIPYWSDECGEVFYDYSELEDVFVEFQSSLDNYTPQKYIEENLSLKKSLEKFLNILKSN